MKAIICSVMALLLGGCASGYSQFYTGANGATPERVAELRVAPPTATPEVVKTSSPPADVLQSFAQQGYALIGSASFTSGRGESESAALQQAIKVGADLVVISNPQYAGTVQRVMPLTLPTSQTSFSTGTATATGPSGTVTAYGSGTTTTYGSRTTYIPYSVTRYSYAAGFFVKRKFLLGTIVRALNDSERQRYQSNTGLYVTTVVNGTPAFMNNILPGDVIMTINGQPVFDDASLNVQLKSMRGRSISVTLKRGDSDVLKTIQLPE